MNGSKILAVGLTAAVVLGGEQFVDSRLDHRKDYPENLVCETSLKKGESPKSLAEASVHRADAGTVIERSQFINPDALLQYAAHDNGHYSTQGLYNVMIEKQKKEPTLLNPPYDYSYSGMRYTKCDFSNSDLDISHFPKLDAAVRILNSTVAVIESKPRDTKQESIVAYRRCGAIAVGPHTLLMPNSEWVNDEQDCVSLARGETDHGQILKISEDKNVGQWRVLKYQGDALDKVQVAHDYQPKDGDELVYCGYDYTGSREYFRVKVAGKSKDGRMLLRAGIDPEPADSYGKVNYSELESGTGGLFTYDGKLVAISESTAKFNNVDFRNIVSDKYRKYLDDQDQKLTDILKDYDFNTEYDYDNSHPIRDQQFIFALRIY